MSEPVKNLTEDLITFGKYKNKTLKTVLKDRGYCKWFLQQDWALNYEYIYNQIKNYDPLSYFLKIPEQTGVFIETYKFFNLVVPEELNFENAPVEITETERKCYMFYFQTVQELKLKILSRLNNNQPNMFDIKAPVKWLQKFEKEYMLNRDEFKQFINSYDLPNITYIVEDIKKEGGLIYKGAQSFNIAKQRSTEQEQWWEQLLKERYREDLGIQFKYENCIFDFINISTNTIFECKLSLKDFNEEQHEKYLITLNKFRIIYLIGNDCLIDIMKRRIYTTDKDKYKTYRNNIPVMKKPTYLDNLIINFKTREVENFTLFLNNFE